MRTRPLADRLRPSDFGDIAGQRHLFGKNGSIIRMTERGYLPNMIFWGPPGTGKTTAAGIIAARSGMTLHRLNATSASTADIKAVIEQSKSILGTAGTLLYLDEIQYFNKKQQQALLESVEDGSVTLITSTTENPYMYVYNALISRSVVFEFKSLSAEDIAEVVLRGLAFLNEEETGEAKAEVITRGADDGDAVDAVTAEAAEIVGVGAEEKASEAAESAVFSGPIVRGISPEALEYISRAACGDVRRSLNILEAAYYGCGGDVITHDDAASAAPGYGGNFDRDGTVHYDLLSALQKSIRGSDPDAAIFYLARILEGGDLIGACRRIQVIASEDIGGAYPMAAAIARACVESARELGMPEARVPLSNAVIMLATAPKSNSAYIAYDRAKADIEAGRGLIIPPYMRPSDRYEGYLYPHDYPDHYVRQKYLPDDIANARYYDWGENKTEQAARAYWEKIKEKK